MSIEWRQGYQANKAQSQDTILSVVKILKTCVRLPRRARAGKRGLRFTSMGVSPVHPFDSHAKLGPWRREKGKNETGTRERFGSHNPTGHNQSQGIAPHAHTIPVQKTPL